MDYVVLETASISELQNRVNEYVQIGWKPIGGASAVRQRVSGPISYLQAVFKENSAPPQPPSFAMPIPIPEAQKRKRGRPAHDKSHDEE